MFEIESRNQDEITVVVGKAEITFNISESSIEAGLEVGRIEGPGEFEIGEATIRGIATESGKTIYDVCVKGIHVGIVGGVEEGLDELGVSDILCTSSVRAIREIEPKVVVAMGNVDGMVTELKMTARMEKKLKVKNMDSLVGTKEVIVLG